MRILGIIPARGGSKRVPHKNLKIFNGKPLIAWAISSAKNSRLDRIIVSTDSKEIAGVAKKEGAEVPFLRPAELAGDKIGMEPVLKHAYEWLKQNENYEPDAIALLQPTNPARTTDNINEAIDLYSKLDSDSLVSVIEAKANHNPFWILKKDDSGKVSLFNGTSLKEIPTRSQDLPPSYIRNDVIYIFKPKNLYEDKPNLYGDKVELMVMDESTDIDINTAEDWFVAEQKIKFRQNLI